MPEINSDDAKKNAAFFAGTDGKNPGETDNGDMASDLQSEADEAGDKPPVESGEQEFVVINEEDVAEESGEGDQPSGTPPKEPEIPPASPELQGLLTSIEGLTELQRRSIENQNKTQDPPEVQDPQPEIDYTDPESVKVWTEWQTRDSDRKITAGIQKYHEENVLPVQSLVLNQQHEAQISFAKTMHGERFDWSKDKEDILKLQEANPSLNVSDAFRHIDYDRLQTEIANKTLKTGELANSQTVASGPSSASSRKLEPTQLIATQEDRIQAKHWDIPIKDWMKQKYQHEKEPGGSLL